MSIFNNDKESMAVMKKFVYFWDCEMVYFFEFVNLLFEKCSLVTAYFVFIDNVDSSSEGGFEVDSFSKFIELILFETRGE